MLYWYRYLILLLIAYAVFRVTSIFFQGAPLVPALVTVGVGTIAFRLLGLTPPAKIKTMPPPQSTAEAKKEFDRLTDASCRPQPPALDFMVAGNPRLLDHYFPIVKTLPEPEVESFYQVVQWISEHPNFDLRLFGRHKKDITEQLPNAVRYLVAGQIAEVFYFRQDILTRFLHTPRHFQLYTTPEAFQQDGGVMGGDYNPSREGIQLVLSRLYEGFDGAMPGVCPFLHELGHMLDHFDAGKGAMGRAEGFYPGLRASDGDIFKPKAREDFIEGKRLELDRYLARQNGDLTQPVPIGHPYVFQNDGEFAAGYLEMFFRNPNYFAAQNPGLYSAYQELFGYDPRNVWKVDFPHYVNANKSFYASGQPLSKTRLTIPDS